MKLGNFGGTRHPVLLYRNVYFADKHQRVPARYDEDKKCCPSERGFCLKVPRRKNSFYGHILMPFENFLISLLLPELSRLKDLKNDKKVVEKSGYNL